MGGNIPLAGSEARPFERFGVVPQHAAIVVADEAEEGLGTGIALLGERLRKPQRGCAIAFLIGRVGGVGIGNRAGEHQRRPISDGLLEPLAVDAEREARCQKEGGAGRRERAPDAGRASCHDLALGRRRLQRRHLRHQGRGVRPASAQCESYPPRHDRHSFNLRSNRGRSTSRSSPRFREASREKPFLSLRLDLDPAAINALMLESDTERAGHEH